MFDFPKKLININQTSKYYMDNCPFGDECKIPAINAGQRPPTQEDFQHLQAYHPLFYARLQAYGSVRQLQEVENLIEIPTLLNVVNNLMRVVPEEKECDCSHCREKNNTCRKCVQFCEEKYTLECGHWYCLKCIDTYKQCFACIKEQGLEYTPPVEAGASAPAPVVAEAPVLKTISDTDLANVKALLSPKWIEEAEECPICTNNFSNNPLRSRVQLDCKCKIIICISCAQKALTDEPSTILSGNKKIGRCPHCRDEPQNKQLILEMH
jgi:hypothetical protein